MRNRTIDFSLPSQSLDHRAIGSHTPGEILYNTEKSDGQFKKTISTAKLQSYLDFQFTPIEEGIAKTVKWFEDNLETSRK